MNTGHQHQRDADDRRNTCPSPSRLAVSSSCFMPRHAFDEDGRSVVDHDDGEDDGGSARWCSSRSDRRAECRGRCRWSRRVRGRRNSAARQSGGLIQDDVDQHQMPVE